MEGKIEGLSVLVVKSVKARVYLKLLEYLVFPVVQRINDIIGDAVFQQDNVPVHTTLAVTEWLEQHNIQVEEYPPYPSDLNPIVVLKKQLHKQYPDSRWSRCCKSPTGRSPLESLGLSA